MITAEQARQNADKYKSDLEKKRPALVAEFLTNVAEPDITEASKAGKDFWVLNCNTKYTCVRAEIIEALKAEGFEAIAREELNLIHVSW